MVFHSITAVYIVFACIYTAVNANCCIFELCSYLAVSKQTRWTPRTNGAHNNNSKKRGLGVKPPTEVLMHLFVSLSHIHRRKRFVGETRMMIDELHLIRNWGMAIFDRILIACLQLWQIWKLLRYERFFFFDYSRSVAKMTADNLCSGLIARCNVQR